MQGIENSTIFAGYHRQSPFYPAGQVVMAEHAFADILHLRETHLLQQALGLTGTAAAGANQGNGLIP